MAMIQFREKSGHVVSSIVQPGTAIKDFLQLHGIPANGVVTTINGSICSEQTSVVAEGDQVLIEQVRHYDLNVIRNPPLKVFGTHSAPTYSKSIVFQHNGDMEVRREDYDGESYIEYLENTFVESVTSQSIFYEGQELVVGLSGGQDSVAFLTLLQRTAHRLPKLQLTAVTVTGLPDWEEPGTFNAAKDACKNIEVNHVIVNAQDVEQTFALRRRFVDLMSEVVSGNDQTLVMIITHHVMRRMIEKEAEKRGVTDVILGLNADDLLATLVTWMTSGYQMGPIPVRQVGSFTYRYPLFRITKKELVIYLRLVAPNLTRQGVPGRFTTGPRERSLAYALTDSLLDLWPGIDYYMFDAYARMCGYQLPRNEAVCGICGASYTLLEGVENSHDLCDVCTVFGRAQTAF